MVESMNIELRWVWRNQPKEKVLQYRFVNVNNTKTHWIDVPVVSEQAENEIGNA